LKLSVEEEVDRELSPGRAALIEKLEDHNAFYKSGADKEAPEEDEEFKDAKDTAEKKDWTELVKKKQKTVKKGTDKAKKEKKDVEAEKKEAKKQLEVQFMKLWAEDTHDPRKGLSLDKGDGKIQIDEKGVVTKFRYFLKKRAEPLGDFPKYFKDFDWTQKGVVRKRFENVSWPALMNKDFTMKDMKARLKTVREALKSLEEVSGKISQLKGILNDQ
jgi:hypothetical protein